MPVQDDPRARGIQRSIWVVDTERRRETADPSLNSSLVFLNIRMGRYVLGVAELARNLPDQPGLYFHVG